MVRVWKPRFRKRGLEGEEGGGEKEDMKRCGELGGVNGRVWDGRGCVVGVYVCVYVGKW